MSILELRYEQNLTVFSKLTVSVKCCRRISANYAEKLSIVLMCERFSKEILAGIVSGGIPAVLS
jgi:hypothetical protein